MQFGISAEALSKPVQELSLFQLAWYVFDHQPFKIFIGISQIVAAALLLINRTVLLGAFLLIPIMVNILIIDLTIMSPGMAHAFAYRLTFYLLLDVLVLWYHKQALIQIWQAIWHHSSPTPVYRVWSYVLLPVCVVVLSFIGVLPKILWALFSDPTGFWNGVRSFVRLLASQLF